MKYLTLLLLLAACQPSKTDTLEKELSALETKRDSLKAQFSRQADNVDKYRGTAGYNDSLYQQMVVDAGATEVRLKKTEKEIADKKSMNQ